MPKENKILNHIFDNLHIGVLFMVFFMACDKFTLYRNFQIIDLFGTITIAFWGLRILLRREWSRVFSDWVGASIVVFVGVVIITSLFSKLTLDGVGNLLELIYFIFLFFMLKDVVDTRRRLVQVLVVWAISASLSSLYGLYDYFLGLPTGFGFMTKELLTGLLQDSNFFAAYLTVGILVAAGLVTVVKPWLEVALSSFILLELFTLIHTAAITGYIMTTIGLICVLKLIPLLFIIGGMYLLVSTGTLRFMPSLAIISPVLLFHRMARRYAIPILMITCCAVFLLPHHALDRIKAFVAEPFEDIGISERLITNSMAIKLTLEHPIKGVGIENGYLIQQEYYKRNFPGEWPVADVHNTYLNISSEAGLFSLAAFLLFIGLLVKRLWQGYKDCEDVFGRNMLYACLIVLLVTLINFFLRVGLYWRFFWVFVALALCANKIFESKRENICQEKATA